MGLILCLLFQAIMMSICLQSMVDELMVKKSGGSIKKVCAEKNTIFRFAFILLEHIDSTLFDMTVCLVVSHSSFICFGY